MKHSHSCEDPFHLRYTKDAKLVGKYHFAQLQPTFYGLPDQMLCFNERSSIKDLSICGLHCFIDDARFECIWSNCDKYIQILKSVPIFIGPDFSLFRDMDPWVRIYNCGRNYSIAYYLAKNGVNIIPVASWGTISDLDWSLDGFQEGCTLSVSSNGCLRDPSSKRIFISGLHIIQCRLHPKAIYVCGPEINELRKYTNVRFFPNFSERKFGKAK